MKKIILLLAIGYWLLLAPSAYATEPAPPAVVDQCDALPTPLERLRCRNARLFGQENPAANTQSQALSSRVGNLIRTVLSLTSIIFLLITVYSGIQWMMAGGNEEIIKKTKARVTRAAIGLVIVVGSWIITNFILNAAFRGGPRASPGTITIPGTGGNVRGFVR